MGKKKNEDECVATTSIDCCDYRPITRLNLYDGDVVDGMAVGNEVVFEVKARCTNASENQSEHTEINKDGSKGATKKTTSKSQNFEVLSIKKINENSKPLFGPKVGRLKSRD